MYLVPHWINGIKVETVGRALPIYQPNIGKQTGFIHVADKTVVAAAVQAAKQSFPTWSQYTSEQRAQCLFKYKVLLEAHVDELAQLIVNEHGKPFIEAVGSIKRGIEVLNFMLGAPYLLTGRHAANVSRGIDCYQLTEPLGVCVGITPFNFPAMIPLWMFVPAIACGNTFVLKPSEKDPSAAIFLVELLKQADVPDGVVNVVHGDQETVDALIHAEEVKAVSFVGSSAIAADVYQKASAANKRVQAFGGAKNHCVVMPDADFDKAAELLMSAAYGSAGERCMAISAVVAVTDAVADKLIDKLIPLIKKMPVKDIGPLVTKAHWQRVMDYIELGKKEGAKLVVGDASATAQDGFFMAPCLFDQVSANMRIYQEEIFGPVLGIVRVASLDAAIALINKHSYGNGCAIFTASGQQAHQFSRQVTVGMVGINVPVPIPAAYIGFGGFKQSSFSDLGMYGEDAIRFFTNKKKVTERWF